MFWRYLIFGICVVAVITIIVLDLKRQKKLKAEAHKTREAEKFRTTRVRYGNQIFNALEKKVEALRLNYERGDILIVRMKENGGKDGTYSIHIGQYISWFNTYGVPGYPGSNIATISVNYKDMQPAIHVLWGVYPRAGSEWPYDGTDSDVERLIKEVSARLEAEVGRLPAQVS